MKYWQYETATVEPLKRSKGRFYPANNTVKSGLPTPKSIQVPERSGGKYRKASNLALFDRNRARKIRGGRLEIEACVDLHGMRQHEAHAALRRFLLSCQSRGLRYVLIITGKGKEIRSWLPPYVGEADRECGVLKQNVPCWLEGPDLRALVVSFMTAAIQHGGEGAIYVHLRLKRRM